LYEYDFGDGWRHELLLEEVLTEDERFSRSAWRKAILSTRRLRGREGFAALPNAVRDANHPGHEEVCEWLGDDVPEFFSADEINPWPRRHREH
jgi:hypothetical protein